MTVLVSTKTAENIINLHHHKEDFGPDAEWQCFAISHGKGPYDCIGETNKRQATKASLLQPYNNHIQTHENVYAFTKKISPV